MVNLAFLGCGYATRLHSKALRSFQEVRRYYASRDPRKAEAYCRRFQGDGFFASYESALEDPRIHAVLVAVPPAFHLELALRSLRAGKDVIVEKPAFLRSADCDTVRSEQARTGKRVFVAENYFYKPLAFELRKILASGWIGKPLFVYVNALKRQATGDWRDDPALAGGGFLFEGGIHWIHFISHLGLTLKCLKGFPAGRAEKSVLVSFAYEEGASGSLYYSWEIPSFHGLRLSKIFGTEGTITFESNGLFLFLSGRKKRFFLPGISDLSGRKAMLNDFLRALTTGEETKMTLDMAQRDLQWIEKI